MDPIAQLPLRLVEGNMESVSVLLIVLDSSFIWPLNVP